MGRVGIVTTGLFLLEWAGMAVSLFNMILLLWLGFTVLLNAQRRTWGIWLAGCSLLLGGAFFAWHSAVLRYNFDYFITQEFWRSVGWIPVLSIPFAWYLITLWYGGFWERKGSALRRRQRPWFVAAVVLAISVVGLLAVTDLSPYYIMSTRGTANDTPAFAGVPLLVLFYPVYILLCIALSLDALIRPEPSGRMMGDLARRRARPWLIATALVQLLVSMVVAWAMVWIAVDRSSGAAPGDVFAAIAWFDLATATLLAVATLLAGQGIVSYEVFTGRTLPRRGFVRHWRNAVVLAAGYGAAAGLGSTLHLPAIYGLLLTTVLMVLFYALLGWRTYAERERFMEQLRPFVASQQLYAHVLTGSGSEPSEVDVATPFRALCGEVLGAGVAYLHPLGALAPLSTSVLSYPDGRSIQTPWLADVVSTFRSPETLCAPLDPVRHGGLLWAVPLWGERGLIGVLLLGEKRDGSLYAQEEIEIARASGERLIDTKSSAEIARHLMALQRQRLAESQVLDQQTRRTLHDDVLPQLHAAMLALSSEGTGTDETIAMLGTAHRQISDLLREMPTTGGSQVASLGIVGALRQVAGNELSSRFDDVTWRVDSEAERRSGSISPIAAEVLFYAAREAIRNAARHGRDANDKRELHLTIDVAWRAGLSITIEDDGIGIGRSSNGGGSGQGLALHGTMMAVVGGSLETESVSGRYTRVVLMVPEG